MKTVVIIEDNEFVVKLADTPIKRIEGMQKQRFDDNFNGMLFLMPKVSNCFWMKDCLIPLDIIFIKDNTITKIFENCPPCFVEEDCTNYCGRGSIVLEVFGGTCKRMNIKKGDRVRYNLRF